MRLRTLLARHLVLLRAELGAIAREALGSLFALILAATLVAIALLVAAGSGLVALSLWLTASPLAGVVAVITLPLVVAVLLLHRGLRIAGTATLLALALGALAGLACALLPLGDRALTAALAIGLGGLVTVIAGLFALRGFDREAFAARFYPHASEAELRRTIDALVDER